MDYTKLDLTVPTTTPRQKISTSLKTEDWCKENGLWFEDRLINRGSYMGSDGYGVQAQNSKTNMKRNCNLYYNNVLSTEDVAKICNPYNIKDFQIPADFKHYKIENPKIQTLKGEELKRRFEWKVYVSNRDAVSQKEEQKKEQYFQFVAEQIQNTSANEEEVAKKLQELQDYIQYDWQEIREITCDQLLHHFNQYLDLKTQFSRAWEYGILNSEEIMSIDEHNGKPVVEACDPISVYWLSSPENPYIDDSDAVSRVYYIPLGQVIDYFYDYLTPSEIDELEARQADRTKYQDFSASQFWHKQDDGTVAPNGEFNDFITNNNNFEGFYDVNGNVRIVHTRWKSFRKIGELTFFDEDGKAQTKNVDENYKVNKDLGEVIRWIWITEAWEVTRIGECIFVKGQPRNVQFRKLDNISYCSLGYVGTKIDNGLFDIMKQYSIQYDAYMWRTEQAMVKALGKIGKLDLSLIPDGWNLDIWMHYATNMGWAVIDSFKEGKKGAAMGKLAGTTANTSDVINLEQGQFIQQNMMMLQYLEAQLDKIVGINNQRQGMLSADAGLQVTREAQQASANITESYFELHDNLKLRTLRALLEVSKWCLKNKVESIQYITSEMTSKIFEIDGNLINEADYGILVGNATNDARTITTLQEAVKIALQTGQVDLIQMMDIFSSDNTASIKRKIEKSVNEKKAQEQANAEQQSKDLEAQRAHEAQMHQELMDLENKKLELKQYEIELESTTKIDIAQIQALGFAEDKDVNQNLEPDVLEQGKLALEHQKFQSDNFMKQTQLAHDSSIKKEELSQKKKESADKIKIEEKKIDAIKTQNTSQELMQKKELADREKDRKSAEKIARMKPKPTKK